jgi:uncharacterized protein (TIGR03067 family)
VNRKVLFLIGFAGVAATGPLLGGDDKGAADLKKLQGTWKFVAHANGDKATPPEELAKMKITFKDDKFSLTVDDKVVEAGTHKLYGAKKPGQVDAEITEGERKGKKMLGIYEFTGKTFKVCFDTDGKERPTSLTAKGSQFAATIEREKK